VMEIRRNEEHDSFINAVTHELKTPIASVRMYLQTLQSREVSEEKRREFYEIMLADTARLHHTVDQVLKAGAARERTKGAVRTVVDVAALTRECVELATVRHHLQPGTIALHSRDPHQLNVKGDADQLRTVLANLLDNAVKYSGSDIHVTVTVWVRVQDRGIGIPKRQLKRIFNRFYRVPSLRIKAVKGTGLGLYIVRSIVRAHGGKVFAQSEGEGRGATFTLTLPRFAGEPDALEMP
jgi:two-component system, OmpR family, sensor histidine kinase SenX3